MKATNIVSQLPISEDEVVRQALATAAPLSKVQVIHSRTGILMQISGADNKVEMRYHADDQLTVLVNEQPYNFNANDAPMVTIDTGMGINSVTIVEE